MPPLDWRSNFRIVSMSKFVIWLLIRGNPLNVSVRRGCRRTGIPFPAATGRGRAFYGSAFFVVIPGFDHEKRGRIGAVVVVPVDAHRRVESFPTRTLNKAIESPLRGGIVEARPSAPDRDLVGMLVLHRVVEVLEILLAPVAAVRRPTAGTGLHPGIRSIEIIGKLGGRFVFVDQQGWPVPTAAVRTNFVPVDVP